MQEEFKNIEDLLTFAAEEQKTFKANNYYDLENHFAQSYYTEASNLAESVLKKPEVKKKVLLKKLIE